MILALRILACLVLWTCWDSLIANNVSTYDFSSHLQQRLVCAAQTVPAPSISRNSMAAPASLQSDAPSAWSLTMAASTIAAESKYISMDPNMMVARPPSSLDPYGSGPVPGSGSGPGPGPVPGSGPYEKDRYRGEMSHHENQNQKHFQNPHESHHDNHEIHHENKKSWLSWLVDWMPSSFGLSGLQSPLSGHDSNTDDHNENAIVPDITQYDNEVVLRFNWHNSKERRAFLRAAHTLVLDIWRLDAYSADVRISSKRVRDFVKLLPRSMKDKAYCTKLIDDLPRAVFDTLTLPSAADRRMRYKRKNRKSSSDEYLADFKNDYMSFADIQKYLESMPVSVSVSSIGNSHEGRPISVVKFSPQTLSLTAQDRKTVLLVCGIHGREWTSIAACIDIIDGLRRFQSQNNNNNNNNNNNKKLSTTTTSTTQGKQWSVKSRGGAAATVDPSLSGLMSADSLPLDASLIDQLKMALENVDIHIIPVLNPDGYVYTWEGDRLWSKNRQPTTVSVCCGVDIDKAFEYDWTRRAGSTPCSDSYEGSHALDGLEAQHLAQYLDPDHLAGYVQLHAYSDDNLIHYVDGTDADVDLDVDNSENLDSDLDLAELLVPSQMSKSKQIAQQVAIQAGVRTENLGFGRGDVNGSVIALLNEAGVPAVQISIPSSTSGYLAPKKKVHGIVRNLCRVVGAYVDVVADRCSLD